MHPVVVRRRGGGHEIDPGGAVFAPAQDRGIQMPCYASGPAEATIRAPIFTCPVSAIPEAVWHLLELWLTCRAMKALPLAGGVLDQPLSVRRAFPLFEAETAPIDHQRDQQALGAAMTAMTTALGGRMRRGRSRK